MERQQMLGIDTKAARYAWSALAAPLLVCLLYLIRRTLFVFVVALMFAYLLYPLVDGIDRRLSRRRRTFALVLPFVLILGLLGAFGVFIGRNVRKEAELFTSGSRIHAFTKRVAEWSPLGLPIGGQISAIERQIAEHSRDILVMMPQLGLGRRMLTASRGLLDLVLIPILGFFILKDGPGIRDTLLEMLDSNRQAAESVLTDAHKLMLQYMRALLLLCLVTLITFCAGLSLLGVHYSILLASIAFPLEFVPLAGPLAAAIVIVGVSYFSGYPHPLWWIVAFLGVYRLFLDYVVSPQLMKKGVELHPLLVLFGVFAGGEIGGIAGIFLSVPVLALLRLLYYELRKRRAVSSVLPMEAVLCGSCREILPEKAEEMSMAKGFRVETAAEQAVAG